MNIFLRYSGIFEVVAVFIIGSFIAGILFQMAGVTSHPLAALSQSNPDMVAIGLQTGKILLLQYIGFLSLAVIFTLTQRQHLLKDRGFNLSGKSIATLCIIGVVGWAAGDFLNKVLWIIDAEFDLGTSVPWREALFNAEPTAGWWFLLFVGSFGLVPILEEVFWRGYVQSRLSQFLSPKASIVLTSIMFSLSHSQYHHADVYHLATLFGVFTVSCVLGWLFYKTTSLIPVIVMHSLLNFPVFGIWAYIVLAVMIMIIAFCWPHIKSNMTELAADFYFGKRSILNLAAATFLGLSMLSLSQWSQFLYPLGWVSLAIAVIASLLFNIQRCMQSTNFKLHS